MSFRINLEIYRGPLDLLLYLVRKHELDPTDVPIAKITDQFLEHLDVLEQLDVNAVGDFIELASILVEMKSRLLLPNEEEATEALDDGQRENLVEQLLQYKQYKDAASILEERGRQWSQHFARQADDLPTREVDPSEQPIHEVELWDLVSALGRVLRENVVNQAANIVYDETPIQVYMDQIQQRLASERQVAFSDMFRSGMHKSALIGVFLAILELIRHHQVDAEQDELHGDIYLRPTEKPAENASVPQSSENEEETTS